MFERFLTPPDRRDLEDLENTLVESEKVKPLDKKDREMIKNSPQSWKSRIATFCGLSIKIFPMIFCQHD